LIRGREMRYVVVECPVCGMYFVLDGRVGYRKCPYCGYVARLGVVREVKRFDRAREASELVRVLNGSGGGFKRLG